MNASVLPPMEIDPKLVKKLREESGAGVMDCKRALMNAGGQYDKAKEILRIQGVSAAAKRAARAATEGVIASYIHTGGKVGVLVEVNCETDFVARNDVLRDFVKDITLQIAASQPYYVSRSEVPAAAIENERRIYCAQVAGKPPSAVEKIVDGKLEKFFSTVCLLEQAFVKNPEITVQELLTSKIAELGENIVIRRFVRFQVGETEASPPSPSP